MFCVVIRVERHDEYDTGNMTAHGVECNTVENAKVLCETNKCNSMPLGAAWAYYMSSKSSRTR